MTTENMIKGRIAECIVEEMLKEAGFKVFRFGYEAVLQHIAHRKLNKQDFYAKLIRDLPDFIILNKNNDVYPVEVKFRKDGKIPKEYYIQIEDAEELIMGSESNEEFEKILNSTSTWQECLVIIVMPKEPYFKIHYPGKWMKKQLSIKEETVPLGSISSYPFMFDKEIINKYAKFVKKYLIK